MKNQTAADHRARALSAVGRHLAEASQGAVTAPGYAIAFHGGKGGVGTTTLAAETAMLLAGEGLRVCAIDSDTERGSMHYHLDLPASQASFELADVLRVAGELTAERLRDAVALSPSGVFLLPSAGRARDRAPAAEHVSRLVTAAREAFDAVVVDTRPSSDAFTIGMLSGCSIVALIVTPELAALGGAARALASLEGADGFAGDVVAVINRSLGGRDQVTGADIASFLGVPVAAVLPEDTARCRRLASECRPLSSERSALARALARLPGALGLEA